MLNRAQLIGHLGRDPESRSMQNGGKVVTFSIATSESWKDKATGEKMERTEWHRIVVFNEHLAEIAEKYLRKGTQVFVEGAIQTRKYTDQGGVEKYTTEIVLQRFNGTLQMVGGKRDGPDYSSHQSGQKRETASDSGNGGGSGGGSFGRANSPLKDDPFGIDLDDDVPF